MMKSILLVVAVLGLLGASLPVLATQTITAKNVTNFEPVKWRITQITGGFPLINETSKTQVVQLVLEHGAVGTHKKALNHTNHCEHYLSDGSMIKSIICELAPSEVLYIDKEFNDPSDATGTYQIAILN